MEATKASTVKLLPTYTGGPLLDTKNHKTLLVVTIAGDAFTPLFQHGATSSALLASRPLIIINSSPDRRTSLAQRVWTWCQELRARYDHPAPESLIPWNDTENNTAKFKPKDQHRNCGGGGDQVLDCFCNKKRYSLVDHNATNIT